MRRNHPLALVGTACALAALALAPAAAQTGKLEASYVVVGGDGPIARAILSGTAQCPEISIGTASQPMRIRARPETGDNPAFPVLVCETAIPAGTASAAIAGRALPLPKPTLSAIAVFGDTGCRLKDFKRKADEKQRGDHDHHDTGQFQDCDRQSKWPFSRLAATVAARKPDLVIHVGDYVYRESACPEGDAGCKGSPHGDNWQTWNADFFAPAAVLLAAAPWIMTRGNHEICERAGVGFFRFIEPTLAQNEAPPACTDLTPPYTATIGGRAFIVMDSSNADDPCKGGVCDGAPYAAQFAALKPAPGSWFVSHRPIWGIGRDFTLNRTLQDALKAWDGKLPDGIDLALSGHMHIFEMLSFTDRRSPQFVIGTGGTALDKPITRSLRGMKIGTATVAHSRVERAWGFAMMTPQKNGKDWTLTFRTIRGNARFSCNITRTEAVCR